MKDGGPAFPVYPFFHEGQNITKHGMTLRDYFAGKALASGNCPLNVYEHEDSSKWAYDRGQAMIAERERRMGDG